MILHGSPLALNLAQPYLPIARALTAPAGRRYLVGWAGAREIHVLAPRALEARASGAPGSREALLLAPAALYASVVVGANSPDSWEGGVSGLLGMEITPFDALRQAQKPVVSAVNGICQGGGLMIAMLSDMAVVSDRATFRAPELFRGIADTHYGHMLTRQVGPARARDLLFTGRTIDAREAVSWGLISRVVPHDEARARLLARYE